MSPIGRKQWTTMGLLIALVLAACANSNIEATTSTEAHSGSGSTTTILPSTTTPPTTTSLAPATSTTKSDPEIVWDYTDPDSWPVVTLLDPGSEPREVRAYDLVVGETKNQTVTMETRTERSFNGGEPEELVTRVTLEVSVSVTERSAEDFTIETVFGPVSVVASDPATEQITQGMYSLLEGRRMHTLLAPNGHVIAVSTTDIPHDLSRFIDHFGVVSARWPSEAIGEGAVWEEVATSETYEMAMVTTSRVSVVEIEGQLVSVKVDAAHAVGPDGLVITGVDPGDATLDQRGHGWTIWDLTTPLSVESRTTSSQMLTATIDNDGTATAFEQRITIDFESVSN